MSSINGATGVGVTARRRAGWAGTASVLWLLAAGAAAQVPQRPLPVRSADGDGPQRTMPVEQRAEQSSARDASVPDGGNRLTPEARRQLRRDVHDAGRDIYRGRILPSHRRPQRQ